MLGHETVQPDIRVSIDLARATAKAPPSYIRGRTFLRDEVARTRGCSALDAERIIDHLEESGVIYFEPTRAQSLPDRGYWRVRGSAQ